ncbi:MAG TPA: hypothetical protein VFA11_08940 [Acidimicrobiales bacterium]|nr:hypothetical protein [Acidimicrobiales bacterium]
MRASRLLALVVVGALAAAACGTAQPPKAATGTATATAADQMQPGAVAMTLESAHPYQPVPPPGGGTDDYHCTLVDPGLKADSMIVASHFFPESPEVHHAILFLIPPDLAQQAKAADGDGQGWTCFGESVLPKQGLAGLGRTPWLSAWAPGHGLDVVPAGTGIQFPAGSLVVMQVHYNLLVGHAPVKSKLVLQTVPATTKLAPLKLTLLPAPPDVPCPAGVSGPLCDRQASLADLGQRFGPELPRFVDAIETVCGRDANNPPAGDSTSCTWPVPFSGRILRLTAHMHLLGKDMSIVLDPGTPQQHVLLDVTNFNFDYQRSYDVSPGVAVTPADRIQVNCTYNPALHQMLPALRRLPPRFVTWGDGSSDEMCLAIIDWVSQ